MDLDDNFHEYARIETEKVYKQMEEVQEQGHICCGLYETYPPRLSWCGKDICEKTIPIDVIKARTKDDKIKEQTLNFIKNLKEMNHTCIVEKKIFPYVEWCNQKQCLNS